MKKIKLITLSLVISLSAFASQMTELSETDSVKLYNALEMMGAFSDSGMNRTGTSASDLKCEVDPLKFEKNSCAIKVLNEKGEMTQLNLQNAEASSFIQLLTEIGIGRCVKQNCSGYELKSIDCSAPISLVSESDSDDDKIVCIIER